VAQYIPVSFCGLRLADEAVRVAIAMCPRLGCSVCVATLVPVDVAL